MGRDEDNICGGWPGKYSKGSKICDTHVQVIIIPSLGAEPMNEGKVGQIDFASPNSYPVTVHLWWSIHPVYICELQVHTYP